MFNGKRKALTFSFDDGVLQDERLIRIFNKYGLKSTFNINSGLLGQPGQLTINDKIVDHTKVQPKDVKKLYARHEIAAHTLTHPSLPEISDEEVIRQVEEDRKALSVLAGYEVIGMAYPGGGVNNDERVAELIRKNTKVAYARTITSTFDFALQDCLYRFNPTVHYWERKELHELIKQFIDLKPNKPALFYIWGHAYEFDIEDTWDEFEDICIDLSGRDDIFYGTNREVFFHKVLGSPRVSYW